SREEAPPAASPVTSKLTITDFASTGLGLFAQRESFHGRADAERENARVRVFLHFGDDLHVVADVPVGHKTDDPDVVLRVGWIEGGADCFHHLGSARSLTGREENLRPMQVFLRRWDWLRK